MLELPCHFELAPVVLPRDQMIAFAERFDPQPFHVNETSAVDTLLGGLSASAWYVCAKISDAIRAGLVSRRLSVNIAGAEQIILFSPIRADDILAATIQLAPLRSCMCGGRGTDIAVDVRRSGGDCVARMALNFVMDDTSRAGSEGGGCTFREGRTARNIVRRRIYDIPFFEQIEVGDEIDLGGYTFGLSEVEEFLFRTCDGGPRERHDLPSSCVPAWHLPAAWMQCMLRHYEATTARHKTNLDLFPRLGPAAGFKNLRWHRCVALGEEIAFRGWAERKLVIPSQKDWGLLVVGAEGIDSHGNSTVTFYAQMLLERAHPLR